MPATWEASFILPVAFLAMVAPMLKSPAHLAAAFVSIVVGLALTDLPSGTGLLIAAFCAMATGVTVETLLENKA